MKTTIGGDRLGTGNKQEVSIRNYNRSTHDLGYLWRSSMASGTLVPFMSEVALPGDVHEIDLACEVMTLPTIGPLFGSYKVQLDVFECPIRLYNGKLHMNMLNIGMDMSKIKLPQIEVKTFYNNQIIGREIDDNEQINPSSILSYFNIRGLGRIAGTGIGTREFNAIPYLAYWDIYKQYYANKQEERGMVLHTPYTEQEFEIDNVYLNNGVTTTDIQATTFSGTLNTGTTLDIMYSGNDIKGEPIVDDLTIEISGNEVSLKQVFKVIVIQGDENGGVIECTVCEIGGYHDVNWNIDQIKSTVSVVNGTPDIEEFPLENIDQMRMNILADVNNAGAFKIDSTTLAPYGLPLAYNTSLNKGSILASQEGLGLKTYQSDLFNNWISTEWIDGTNGINEITSVDTSAGNFSIDALNMANKVYNMLNRIAVSGGSYDDWLDAVYTHERAKSTENPIYHGSLIKELGFQEVISTSDVETSDGSNPLGTLAGRGRLTSKNKGGRMKINVSEPSYIIGIASLTPRIDYSQGNKWDTGLKTLNDLHKPALDAIGYQDLITDQMHWADTTVQANGTIDYKSVGKVPAWINYMTNTNQVRGNFAVKEKEMFMTLNRRYEAKAGVGIEDITTYIDPSKYNQIFAQSSLDSQNFWTQISVRNIARRKMSAKVIPNL